MSEGDISKLIRGDKDALAKQAATGGNTKPAPAPGTTPTPAGTAPAATPNPATPANPAATPTNPANPANPTQPPTGMPPVAPTPTTPPEEEKKEEEKTIQYKDTSGSGPQFIFGMGGKGDINEGADEAASMGAQQELLKKLVKKIQAKGGPVQATPPPPTK